MKKIIYAFTLSFLGTLAAGPLAAQVCTVDMQYTAPGIYPSDTLADMQVAMGTLQVLQFVFPVDTVVFGQTIPFDSFQVDPFVPPAGLLYECDQNHPVCTYVTAPPALTRGCVKIYGTPISSTPYPLYDSLVIQGRAYFTVFGTAQSIGSPISIYYRVMTVGIDEGQAARLNLQVQPQPAHTAVTATFELETPARARLRIIGLCGEEVRILETGDLRSGSQALHLDVEDLADGIYLLRLELDGGHVVAHQRLVVMH
jgi:hypothetical protein